MGNAWDQKGALIYNHTLIAKPIQLIGSAIPPVTFDFMMTELNELDTIYQLAIASSPMVVPFLNKVLAPTGDEIGKFAMPLILT